MCRGILRMELGNSHNLNSVDGLSCVFWYQNFVLEWEFFFWGGGLKISSPRPPTKILDVRLRCLSFTRQLCNMKTESTPLAIKPSNSTNCNWYPRESCRALARFLFTHMVSAAGIPGYRDAPMHLVEICLQVNRPRSIPLCHNVRRMSRAQNHSSNLLTAIVPMQSSGSRG